MSTPRKDWALPSWRDLRFGNYQSPHRDSVAMHEWHAEVADYRMRHQGVLPELERYVAGLCKAAVR